jgi:hypothetical protein
VTPEPEYKVAAVLAVPTDSSKPVPACLEGGRLSWPKACQMLLRRDRCAWISR